MTTPGRTRDKSKLMTWVFLLLSLLGCVLFSSVMRPIKPRWPGVTPAPSQTTALMYGFGDRQLAYYALILTLQNMGDIGGSSTPIKDYNMDYVAQWLRLSYGFDKMSRYGPTLAGYYFGATQDPSKLRPIINYLGIVGNTTENELWRYLAQGVYLARFRLKDQDLALELAYRLAALDDKILPIWTKQMPAFVMTRIGDKEASRDLFLTLMATSRNISRQELNFMCDYIQRNLREKNDGLEKNEIWIAFCKGRKF